MKWHGSSLVVVTTSIIPVSSTRPGTPSSSRPLRPGRGVDLHRLARRGRAGLGEHRCGLPARPRRVTADPVVCPPGLETHMRRRDRRPPRPGEICGTVRPVKRPHRHRLLEPLSSAHRQRFPVPGPVHRTYSKENRRSASHPWSGRSNKVLPADTHQDRESDNGCCPRAVTTFLTASRARSGAPDRLARG
jgi:hypothetical protein